MIKEDFKIMAKYKLAISIPTYERPDCITDLVDYMIDEAERLNVGIYVFDGSEKTDDTEVACKKYEKYNCFNYIRHSGTIGKRHVEAIYRPDCEYLWLTRDRTILKKEFWPIVINLFELQYDIIILGAIANPEYDHVRLYTNPKELIKEFVCSMTYLGSYLVKKSFLRDIEYTNDDYMTNFPLISKVFASAIETQNFKALYMPLGVTKGFANFHNNFTSPNLLGTTRLEVWSKNWVGMIEALPAEYDSEKNHLKLIRSRDVWSFFEYVKFCSYGNFSVKDLYEYKKYIVQVSNIPWGVMVFLAAMPCWFNHIIREIIRPINRIFRDRLIKNLEISLNKSILIMSINKVKYKVSYNV